MEVPQLLKNSNPAVALAARFMLENAKRRAITSTATDCHDWIVRNQFVNENGVLMEFSDREFLVDPLKDESKQLVVNKASQIGFSTISIFKSIYQAVRYGRNIIYTLPTDSDVQEFNKAKTNMILAKNPDLRAYLVDDTLHTKSYRTLDGSNVGFIFSKGTHGASSSIMQSADLLVKDEFDRSNQNVLNAFKSRITASSYGAEWSFSNPSFPGFGTDEIYQQSDQKHWFFWCPHCDHPAYFTWEPESFDGGNTHFVCREQKAYVCGACEKPFDRRQADKEWVQKYPSMSEISGYWLSQFCAPWITAEYLLREKKLMMPDVWANFIEGRPYASNSSKLDPASILKCCQYDEYGSVAKNPGKFKLAGSDVGGTIDKPHFYITLGTEAGVSSYHKIHGEDSLHRFMRMENIALIVVDNMPFPELVIRLVNAFPGKVLRCTFDYDDVRKEVYKVDFKTRMVNIHRTRIFDRTVDGYVTGERKLYMDNHHPLLYNMEAGAESICKHWSVQRKIGTAGETKDTYNGKEVKFDSMGNARPMWHNDGADHLSLSDCYQQAAQLIFERQSAGTSSVKSI